jgi:hypothetical protein
MIFGFDESLNEFLERFDKMMQVYVNPEQPYGSPKIVTASLKTIKEFFISEVGNFTEFIQVNLRNLKNEFKEETSNFNSGSKIINEYGPTVMNSVTIFFSVASVCIIGCSVIYICKSYEEYQLKKFQLDELKEFNRNKNETKTLVP